VFVSVAIVFGTSHMTVHFGSSIHNPALGQVLAIATAMGVLHGVPLVVLLSRRARRQFAAPAALNGK
jgi:hypothetical protein